MRTLTNLSTRDVLLLNKELIELYSALVELENVTAGPVFTHAIVTNLDRLRPLAQRIENDFSPTPQYRAYEDERDILCRQHARKDSNGEPITVDDAFAIANHAKFKPAIEKLRAKYRDAITHYEAVSLRLHEFLTLTGPTVSLCRVRLVDCPTLTPIQMRGILPMIEPITETADTTSNASA